VGALGEVGDDLAASALRFAPKAGADALLGVPVKPDWASASSAQDVPSGAPTQGQAVYSSLFSRSPRLGRVGRTLKHLG
jgi:hypothetical protein